MPNILVIDDDRSVRHLIRKIFEPKEDYQVSEASSAEEGVSVVEQDAVDVVLLDVMLPKASGLEGYKQIHEVDPKLPVIFITSGSSSDTAIEAMKLGAHEFLTKPLDVQQIEKLVRQALDIRRLMHVSVEFHGDEAEKGEGDVLVGKSPQMQDVYKSIGRVAPQDVAVLLLGESGTGKELVARAIYQHSKRSEGPFLAVNCATLTDTLLESELFGHEKGSFTGADRRRIGKFEQCSGGTIFLDEVGDMSPLVQSKVLRVLQEQQFERVGGNETITTDVRIISATNRNLEEMIDAGEFRKDLYYRLNGFTIELPPLRERGNDLELLLQHFLQRIGRELGKEDLSISPEALELLKRYPWPGNVREVQSVIRQSLLLATGSAIIPDFLPESIRDPHAAPVPEQAAPATASENGLPYNLKGFIDSKLAADTENLYEETLQLMERYLLSRVLRLTGGNKTKAAEILGITRGSLRHKIESLGLSIDSIVKVDEPVEAPH